MSTALARQAAACLTSLPQKAPLTHCIVGPVAMRDCANALLAVGARPIMAQEPLEVEEITARADSLVLNTGTLTASSAQAMVLAGKKALHLGHPLVLDLVGIGLSALRRDVCAQLIKETRPSILKGNASELRFLLFGSSATAGVDSHSADAPTPQLFAIASEFAQNHSAVLLLTGPVDYIIAPGLTYAVQGGSPMLGKITATGCIIGALCGAFLAVASPQTAAITAACAMGIAGEQAAANGSSPGTGSFGIALLDALSTLRPEQIKQREEHIRENPF